MPSDQTAQPLSAEEEVAELLHEGHVGCGTLCESVDLALTPVLRASTLDAAMVGHRADAAALLNLGLATLDAARAASPSDGLREARLAQAILDNVSAFPASGLCRYCQNLLADGHSFDCVAVIARATLDAARQGVGAGLREALEQIDALPAGHYRRNGFASPDPWVRQRDVQRIARRALAAARQPVEGGHPCGCLHQGPCRESECGHAEWQDAARQPVEGTSGQKGS